MICESMFRLKKNGEPVKNCCYCMHPELIENYEKAIADTTQVWDCHHRMEEVFTTEELKRAGWYYNVKPQALIFLTHAEHAALHKKGKKLPLSEETKEKISAVMKGKPSPHKGKKHSAESKANMSAAHKGKHWKLVDGKRVWY